MFPTTAELSDFLSRPAALIMQVKNLDESFCGVFPSLYMCFLLWGIQIKEEGCQGMAGRGTTCVVQSVLSSIASFSPNLFYFNKTNKINNKNDKRHASNS